MQFVFFFQAEDGIRDLVRSRGLGDVYKRQPKHQTYHITFVTESGYPGRQPALHTIDVIRDLPPEVEVLQPTAQEVCLLYTSDAADERSSVDLGGRRIIKKKKERKKKKKKEN